MQADEFKAGRRGRKFDKKIEIAFNPGFPSNKRGEYAQRLNGICLSEAILLSLKSGH